MVDLQAVGELVLVDDGAGFTVQVRQGRWRGSSETIAGITALAARVGDHRVAFYPGDTNPVRVDGTGVALTAEVALSGGGSIVPLKRAYLVKWPGGEEMHVRVVDVHLDVMLRMPRTASRRFAGLLGDGDRDPGNDIALRDGTVLPQPVKARDLYDRFAESWRIAQTESLFDYPSGRGTADFTDRALPSQSTSAAQLSSSEHATAMKLCSDLGVVMPAMLNACALDYATSKDPGVIRAYQGMPAPVAVNSTADYWNDFERATPDSAWMPALIGEIPAPALLGPSRFAGPFTGEPVAFRLANLPAHAVVTVSFDLYVMGAWSGEEWSFGLRDAPLTLAATFDNLGGQQSYPDFSGVALHPARTGAGLIDALSARTSGIPDAVYHQRYTFAHAAEGLILDFLGPPLGSDPSVRWGIDNFEVLLGAPSDVSLTTVGSVVVTHGPAGPPAVVGCADGRREGFLDVDRFPRIAGCMATWADAPTLRAPATGASCGDGIGTCAAPADACAAGWHVCVSSGNPADLTSSASSEQCLHAGGGYFASAMSHCNGPSSTCNYADDPGETASCLPSAWCSEPVCCGSSCARTAGCRDGVWPGATRLGSSADGCGRFRAPTVSGVLCCR